MTLFEAFQELWCVLRHDQDSDTCKFCAPLKVPQLREFDWLRDYGPLWEPATTAFWLAPDTEAEVESWYRKYRPEEVKPKPHPLQNAGINQVAQYREIYENACRMGCDPITLSALYDQYRDALLRHQRQQQAMYNQLHQASMMNYSKRNNNFLGGLFG